jgi:hypothetical protein
MFAIGEAARRVRVGNRSDMVGDQKTRSPTGKTQSCQPLTSKRSELEIIFGLNGELSIYSRSYRSLHPVPPRAHQPENDLQLRPLCGKRLRHKGFCGRRSVFVISDHVRPNLDRRRAPCGLAHCEPQMTGAARSLAKKGELEQWTT